MDLSLRPRTHRPVSGLVLTPTNPPTRWWLTGLAVFFLTSGAWAQCFKTNVDYPVGNVPRSMAVGDFNGDGKPDLATANQSQSSNSVSVLLNTGSGSFGAATNFGVGNNPISLAVGDFNADGKPATWPWPMSAAMTSRYC